MVGQTRAQQLNSLLAGGQLAILLLDVVFVVSVLFLSFFQLLLSCLSEQFELLLDPNVLSDISLEFNQLLFVGVDVLSFLWTVRLVLFYQSVPDRVEKSNDFLFGVHRVLLVGR